MVKTDYGRLLQNTNAAQVPMEGIREKKKRKTKRAILDAAIILFGETGYEQTSMAALASKAGIGKSTIYTYFATKREILIAFCEDELEYVYKEINEQANPDASLVDQLHTIFMAEFRFVTRNKEFGRLFLRESVFPKDLTVEHSHELDSRYIDLLFAIFDKCQQRGELRKDRELLFVAAQFYSLYLVTVSSWYSGRLQTEDDVAEGMRMLFEQAMEGLGPTTISYKEKTDYH